MTISRRYPVAAIAGTGTLGLAGVVFAAQILAGQTRTSFMAMFALAGSLVLVGYALRSRALAGRAGTVAALAIATWPLVLFVVADGVLGAQLVTGPPYREASLLGFWGAIAYLSPFVVWALAPLVTEIERALGRAAHVAAPVAWAVALAMTAVALVRSGRPDPDTYVSRLPVTATLALGDAVELAGQRLVYGGVAPISRAQAGHERTCVLRSGAVDQLVMADRLTCSGLEVVRDDVSDVWVLRTTDPSKTALGALRGARLEHTGLHPRDVHRSLAPPVGWTHAAAGGLVVALVPLVAAARFRRRAKEARAASHGPGAGYRASAREADDPLVANVVDEAEARARGASLAAIVVLGLTAAPLAAALAHGLAL
jgi:hypothetical protein